MSEVRPIEEIPWDARSARFNETTGTHGYMTVHGPTGADHHPDRCVCQNETTPHKHYPEPPHSCARCLECTAYEPAIGREGRP